MNSIDNIKKEIRNQIKLAKRAFSFEEKKKLSESIWTKLEEAEEYKKAQTILLYWSMKDEVHTHEMVLKAFENKRVILPTVKGDVLVLKEFKGMDQMVAGEGFGIPEPAGDEFKDVNEIDLMIIPGVAFDSSKNRMGRGRAYYDKLLKTSKAPKLGVCFNFQIIDQVPVDEHDIPMDMIISN